MEKMTIGVYPELCDALGISKPAAYALAHSDGFPAIRIGRKIRIPVDGLKRWMRENEGKKVKA